MMKKTDTLPLRLFLHYAPALFPVGAIFSIALLTAFPDVLSDTVQLTILGIVIASLGLPHGALDPWIAEKIGLSNTRQQIIVFTTGYLAIAALVVLFWVWQPALSLLIFLLISAWHFSADWKHSLSQPLRVCAGALLLLMPIGFHTESVGTIFQQLSGDEGKNLANFLALPTWFLVGAIALISAAAAWKQQWSCLIECLTLLMLAYFTAPLLYFTLYFCLLHSPRHLLGLFADATPANYKRLLHMMFVYTFATLFLLGGLWWVWSALPVGTLILRLIFIGLAAVTVPHMLLIAIAAYKARS